MSHAADQPPTPAAPPPDEASRPAPEAGTDPIADDTPPLPTASGAREPEEYTEPPGSHRERPGGPALDVGA